MIDIYCERLGPGLWAEPVNLLTNLAFFIAAFFVWRLAEQRGMLTSQAWLLILLIIAIGTGSGLLHSFATPWARRMDELSIVVFQLVYLWLYGRQVIGVRAWSAAGLVLVLLLATLATPQFSHLLNGSLGYAPAFVLFISLGIYHFRRAQMERGIMLWALLVFAVSLSLRTIDMALCESVALGTHFLWHGLNGVVLYLVTRGLLLQPVPR